MDPMVDTTTIVQVQDAVSRLKSDHVNYIEAYQRLFGKNGCISRLPFKQYSEFVTSADYPELMNWLLGLIKSYRGAKRMLTPRLPIEQIEGLEAEAETLKISVNQLISLKLSLPLVALAK